MTAFAKSEIKPGRAVCAICSPSVDVFPLTLTEAEATTLEAAVITNAKSRLVFPIADAVLDYIVLPESVRRVGTKATGVLVYAIPRSYVDTLLTRLEAAKLQVGRIMTPACAIASQLVGTGEATRRVLVSTGEDATSIAVIEDGHVLLERMLQWGTKHLAERLQSELDLDPERALALLAASDQTAPGEKHIESAVKDILAPSFLELAREVSGCLGYCTSFLKHRPIEALLLVGALSGYTKLMRFLQDELEIPVSSPIGSAPAEGHLDAPLDCTHAVSESCALWKAEEAA